VKKIQKTQIIGTETTVYTAWEPSTPCGRHGTITTIDGEWYGRIGTDPDPEMFEHLPVGSDARIAAVKRAYALRYEAAYLAIIAKYPELIQKGTMSNGEIEVVA
jgi:hypothetical protein